jgi:hypothetical protein
MISKVEYPFFEISDMDQEFVRVRSHIHPDTVNAVFLKRNGTLFTMYNRSNKKPDGKYSFNLRVIDTLAKRVYKFSRFGGIFDSKNRVKDDKFEIIDFSNKDSLYSTSYNLDHKKNIGTVTKNNLDEFYRWLKLSPRKVHRFMYVNNNEEIIEYEDSLVLGTNDTYPYFKYVNEKQLPLWKIEPMVVEEEDTDGLKVLFFKRTSFDDEDLDRTHHEIDNLDNNFRMGIFRLANTRLIDLNKKEYLSKK